MTVSMEQHRIRVLLVEDEPLLREAVADALRERGLDVHAVASGEAALRQLERGEACDVLFTDINLGRGIDGVALSFAARRLRPDLPVVYASGSVGGLAQLRPVTGASFLRKPYDLAAAGALLRAAAAVMLPAPA